MTARYFLVHYIAYLASRQQFIGLSSVITEGQFINQKRFIKDIKEEGKDNGQDITSVLITQIMELNEKDYLNWHE